MARSATILNTDTIPTWARYAVVFCYGHMMPGAPVSDTIQVFGSRAACERYAMAVSRYFPARDSEALTMWALVYALPARRDEHGYWGVRGGQCYLAIDPGAVVLKRHEIMPGYGLAAPTPRKDACACCPPGGW